MRILIATVLTPFLRGGAELLAEELRSAVRAQGHEVDLLYLPWYWYPLDELLRNLAAYRSLEMSDCGGAPVDRLIALKFPAYLIRHPEKVIWVIHQHRQAYDMWDDVYGLAYSAEGACIREMIRAFDRAAVQEARQVFSISRNVADRLQRSVDHESEVLYPPLPGRDVYRCEGDEGYLLFPSRISPVKRHALVLDALALTREPVRMVFAGSGDHAELEEQVKQRAVSNGVADRVEWLGYVSREELLQRLSRARAVVFPPQDEDFGYVTLEAMLSSKPVITCSDSGGALELVAAERTGIVAEPSPSSLAAAMDRAWSSPTWCSELGRAGREVASSLDLRWSEVVDRLVR